MDACLRVEMGSAGPFKSVGQGSPVPLLHLFDFALEGGESVGLSLSELCMLRLIDGLKLTAPFLSLLDFCQRRPRHDRRLCE